MKKISCADMGKGDCHFSVEGETADEVKSKMMDHAREMHPDVMETVSENELMKMMDEKMIEV